ncbi:hypothetical protein DENIT_60194 [Pseudomonas veronii]|nr:hypothetical protein DENIT_60194 [Pseudomonas veronii]
MGHTHLKTLAIKNVAVVLFRFDGRFQTLGPSRLTASRGCKASPRMFTWFRAEKVVVGRASC